jgi:hypothetical protein
MAERQIPGKRDPVKLGQRNEFVEKIQPACGWGL